MHFTRALLMLTASGTSFTSIVLHASPPDTASLLATGESRSCRAGPRLGPRATGWTWRTRGRTSGERRSRDGATPELAATRRQPRRQHRFRLLPTAAPLLHAPFCRAGEEARGLSAYEREYEDDHSWEELEEDEFGNLRALVRSCCSRRFRPGGSDPACTVCLASPLLHCCSVPHTQASAG